MYYALGLDIGRHLGMGGSIEGETDEDDDDKEDDDDDDGGGGCGHALMRGPGIVLGKDAGEGGCG